MSSFVVVLCGKIGTAVLVPSPGITRREEHFFNENCANSFRIGWHLRFCDQIISNEICVAQTLFMSNRTPGTRKLVASDVI